MVSNVRSAVSYSHEAAEDGLSLSEDHSSLAPQSAGATGIAAAAFRYTYKAHTKTVGRFLTVAFTASLCLLMLQHLTP